jgi:hypothetical protein
MSENLKNEIQSATSMHAIHVLQAQEHLRRAVIHQQQTTTDNCM